MFTTMQPAPPLAQRRGTAPRPLPSHRLPVSPNSPNVRSPSIRSPSVRSSITSNRTALLRQAAHSYSSSSFPAEILIGRIPCDGEKLITLDQFQNLNGKMDALVVDLATKLQHIDLTVDTYKETVKDLCNKVDTRDTDMKEVLSNRMDAQNSNMKNMMQKVSNRMDAQDSDIKNLKEDMKELKDLIKNVLANQQEESKRRKSSPVSGSPRHVVLASPPSTNRRMSSSSQSTSPTVMSYTRHRVQELSLSNTAVETHQPLFIKVPQLPPVKKV